MIAKYKTSTSRRTASRRAQKPRSSSSQTRIRTKPRASDRDKLRVIVLGGLEEVGRNMTLLEYNQEIIIIDMGLQFPEEDMPGIDYIIPNVSYLEDKAKWIKGIIITHGHMDHIGGIPHIIGKIGNPPSGVNFFEVKAIGSFRN